MPNFCAAPNCRRKSTQSDLAFFRFPRDPARCQKWVENCRRADLEDKTPDQLKSFFSNRHTHTERQRHRQRKKQFLKILNSKEKLRKKNKAGGFIL
ncbi:unnamed protein product [Nyctereutes procyonoides]|uniref:(raccoon dog) hypothetical protein n=1 Tax=Nyctereutes procyonoides TaxID=34880 RepID=A0A811Z6E7_NYCPR|nr:unnamed protein product [Nyctereutes procyonoides]